MKLNLRDCHHWVKLSLIFFLAWLKYGQHVYGIAEITNIKTIDDFFKKVSECCTFLDCDLFEDIASNLPGAFGSSKTIKGSQK